jgi:tellurite resistance protein
MFAARMTKEASMAEDLLNPHTALVYIMVLTSAADRDMTDQELLRIGDIIRTLPVFDGFDQDQLVPLAEECAAKLDRDDGLEAVLDVIVASLPANISETAYAIACEIAAADLHVEQEELRMLEMLRHGFNLDRLTAAAIERGVRARYATL